MSVTTELLLMGIDLEREIRLLQHEADSKKVILADTRKTIETLTANLQDTKTQLCSSSTECQELKAQLQVRVRATQKLEEENTYLRDCMAKATVQMESYLTERHSLMERCSTAEAELSTAKEKISEMTGELAGTEAYKEMCVLIHNQNKETIQDIISKQALLDKEQARLERSRTEGISFAQEVAKKSALQAEFVKQANSYILNMEDKIYRLIAALEEVTKERDSLQQGNNAKDKHNQTYLDEWKLFQETMKERLEGSMQENRLLTEEIQLVRINSDKSDKCTNCGEHF